VPRAGLLLCKDGSDETVRFPTDDSPARCTVLVADSHALVRDCFKLLVADVLPQSRFLDAGDGNSLFAHAAQAGAAIRVALVDLVMPGMRNGQRLLELARDYPAIPVIATSAVASPELARWVVSIPSVHAFVPKSASVDDWYLAIACALARRKAPFAYGKDSHAAQEPELTPRQAEIRGLLREGLSNKSIAKRLGICEGTVKNHVSEILRTLRATNRAHVVRLSFGEE
jgi:DNA-binding NarL/FixJ family response regulator